MPTFYAWLNDKTNSKDSKPMAIKAKSLDHALKIAMQKMDKSSFTVDTVYTKKGFERNHPGWIKAGLV